jgi:hypothetical protein
MNTDGRFTIKVWTYVENLGDGSCGVRFFNSEAEANAYADEDNSDRFCDDVNPETLEFDTTPTGYVLLNADKHNRNGN